MATVHREGLKVGAIGGLITAAIGTVVIILGLGAWGARKADQEDVRALERSILSNEKRISILEARAENAAEVNKEILDTLRDLRETRSQRRGG